MSSYSENLDFEKAQQWKEKLLVMEDYQSKSTVVSTSIADVDVFSIARDEEYAYINFMKVINGSINQTITIEADINLEEDNSIMLSLAVEKIRIQYNSIAPEIIVPILINPQDGNPIITIPQRGDKRNYLICLKKFSVFSASKEEGED